MWVNVGKEIHKLNTLLPNHFITLLKLMSFPKDFDINRFKYFRE